MATSQQFRNATLMVAATLVVLFIGSADAWGCPKWYKDCNPHKPGCETCIKDDVKNCGACGKCCKTLPYVTTTCVYGKCVYTCKHGWANCDKNIWSNGCETDVSKDARNCGECGKCCKQVPYAITKCSGGKCQEPVCKAGWANCDKNIWSNGCEKDVSKDIYNCGSCGNCCKVTVKGAVGYCSYGKCEQRCMEGWTVDKIKNCCVPIHH